MGSCGVVGIVCGYGRNLMLVAFKVAHMSCTQRQRGGAAERGEAHVGGRGVVGWSGIVGIVCGCGSGRNLMLAAFQVAHMSCTQRQRGGVAERGEAHVGGCGAVGWSSVVGIASGSG